MSNIVQKSAAGTLEEVLVSGNLGSLTIEQRLEYYNKLCESLGLNPLTKPFDYITLNGKLTLYAKKDATDQLRKIHGVSITKLEKTTEEGIHLVTAYAQDATGRVDVATGATATNGLKGDNLVNAYLKAETKAKRRVTLSIVGLGLLDETEIETIKEAIHVDVTPKVDIRNNSSQVTLVEAPKCKIEPEITLTEDELAQVTFTLDGVTMNGKDVLVRVKQEIESIVNSESLEEYKVWKEDHKAELVKFSALYPSDTKSLGALYQIRERDVMMIEYKYNKKQEALRPITEALEDDKQFLEGQ